MSPDQNYDDSDLMWREGNALVVPKSCVLPPRCVKTNQYEENRKVLKLYWHHPAVYLALLANLLIFLILALVLRKKGEVNIAVSEDIVNQRQFRAWMAGLAAIFGLGLFVGSFFLLDTEYFLYFLIGGLLIGMIAGIYAAVAVPILKVKKMDNHWIWLTGFSQQYLETFPYGPPGIPLPGTTRFVRNPQQL